MIAVGYKYYPTGILRDVNNLAKQSFFINDGIPRHDRVGTSFVENYRGPQGVWRHAYNFGNGRLTGQLGLGVQQLPQARVFRLQILQPLLLLIQLQQLHPEFLALLQQGLPVGADVCN